MYDKPQCPCCYLQNIVCATCKSDKPKMPCGVWSGHWWYCGSECLETPFPPGEHCLKHKKALERLKKDHPDLFRR